MLGVCKMRRDVMQLAGYFSVWQRLLYQSRRPHFFSLYTFSSQTTQYGFAEIHGHLCAWLNLTGGELDPHDTLVRMPYVLRGERVLEWKFMQLAG